MSIYFFTDPHLGVTRHSHTTVPSRQRLKEAVFDVVGQVLAQAGQAPVICLGDLFDTTTNDEATIYQGMVTAKRCAAILAGNHDLPNREGKLSSLQLLSTFNDQVIRGHLDSPGFQFQLLEGTGVYFVPHMATQELFDQSLSEVTAYARANPQPQTLLCLHCNYNSGLIHNDASLNLPRERAAQLLESFTYVLLGHEHIPRTDFGGRLLILGNTHPTSFSDISDKWLWKLEGGQFTPIPLWSQADGYRAIAFDALADTAIAAGVQFVDVTGSATLEQMPDIAQQVAHLWRDHPGLLMVRNSVECATSLAAIEVETHKHLDLPSRISTALEGNDLLPLWTHYLGAAQ